MNNFRQIFTYVTVCNSGGISKAAQKLGVAKSAVSKDIKQLEERIGAILLNRNTRGISITDAGQYYLQRCSQILDDLNEAEDHLLELNQELVGTIRVALPVSLGLELLAPIFNKFMSNHPNVTINAFLSDSFISLVDERIDLTIRAGNLADSDLIAKRIGSFTRTACASPIYLGQYSTPKKPIELVEHYGLESKSRSPQEYWQFKTKDGATEIARPSIRLSANNGAMVVSAALEGLGICAVPDFLTKQHINDGRLIPILTQYSMISGGIYAAYPQKRLLSKRVRSLIDFCAENMTTN